MRVLAVIPARGGSKGFPNKNLQLLAGHPLISYSICAGLQSKSVTRTIVSTDSEAIAEQARRYGAEVPFLRPAELAQDDSRDIEFWRHAVTWLSEHEDWRPDFLVQLRPTSPLRPSKLIDECVNKMAATKEADSLRVVVSSPVTPYKMWRISDLDAAMEPLLSDTDVVEPYNAPRQSLPKVYWQVGTLDVIRCTTLTEKDSVSGNYILPHVISSEYAVDIDKAEDLEVASSLIESLDVVKPILALA